MSRHVASNPRAWVQPRPHTDASQRLHTYGPIEPMNYGPRRDFWQAGLALVCAGIVAFVFAVML